MPRPIEPYNPEPRPTREIPVIGSFGFATAGKRFDLIIDQVNREYNEAIIRFNIPEATYVPSTAHTDLAESLKQLARRGIDLQITHDYLTKQELIEWCAYNDLNVFFYYRNMTGLAAVTDQAISAQRPLLVTEDYTFRHIHAYMEPYPKLSMKKALTCHEPVQRMYEDWHPAQFAKKFEVILNG
jgi:hypothetical protein